MHDRVRKAREGSEVLGLGTVFDPGIHCSIYECLVPVLKVFDSRKEQTESLPRKAQKSVC